MVEVIEMQMAVPLDEVSHFGKKIDEVRELREKISASVLGHVVKEPDWILFDDALTHEYDRMVKLLKVLDERAG